MWFNMLHFTYNRISRVFIHFLTNKLHVIMLTWPKGLKKLG